ncbi:MAG: peptidoglycan editing factor PgeF [Ignavibacteriaceae bacterium]
MQIIRSEIFSKYPEVIFGFSTKIGLERPAPYFFNLSLSVGDNEEIVKENRRMFFKELELNPDRVVLQKQTHSDIIRYIDKPMTPEESDAMITDKRDLGLAIGVADCTPVFIYDRRKKIIAGIHSGWRGTEKKILLKTLSRLNAEFNSDKKDLIVFIGPSICQNDYEVGEEVALLFDEKFRIKKNNKYLLDVASVNYQMLLDYGLKKEQVEISELCTMEEINLLHSYRRDGKKSGRLLGVIALREN